MKAALAEAQISEFRQTVEEESSFLASCKGSLAAKIAQLLVAVV